MSRSLSASIQPWVALTRVKYFAGTMVVFWPYAWALTMAARTVALPMGTFLYLFVMGFIGACVSHSTGCVWNDIVDRNIDAKVERTKHRPMASRQISVFAASMFLALHISILLGMIWRANALAWIIGNATIFPLAGMYPLMKRMTYWPQAWLGIAINTGIFMGWATVTNAIPSSAWVLAAGTWCWTIWYDTIYACQDMKDDVKAGVKSTALLFGSRVKSYLAFFGLCFLTALVTVGLLNHQSYAFFLVALIGGGAHLLWQLTSVQVGKPESCWKVFHRNGFYLGAIIECGLLLDYLMTV
ncbi:4-hydroxybenzoate polyprenyl transferase [Hymenopellis radicata]|nr:4-hydroxybenzoate polyprenyl transferase [Hymenopellis radicata]